MSVQGRVFLALGVAFLGGLGIYLSGLYDDAGAILLGGCALYGLWVGVYLLRRHRAVPAIDDPPSAGEVGAFPTATRWTPVLALGIVVLGNGLLAGAWLFLTGLAILGVAVVGYMFEFARSPSPENGSTTDSPAG